MNNDILDLDALVPQPVTIHFDGKDVVVQPPKIIDLIKLGSATQGIAVPSAMSKEELQAGMDKLTQVIRDCIPELQGKELNLAQTQSLVEILNRMGTPPATENVDGKRVEKESPKVQ